MIPIILLVWFLDLVMQFVCCSQEQKIRGIVFKFFQTRNLLENLLLFQEIYVYGVQFDALHNVQFVKYDVTVSFMAQVLDTVTYLVPQVLDTAS